MIYVHVPFCRSFCVYCDFYSETACKGKDAGLFSSYTDELCREIARRREEIENTRELNTLYIGGGTPSVLPLEHVHRIVSALENGPWDEFTMEVNPDDIVQKGIGYVRELRLIGVDRVSMGVQSLDDDVLRWMNRRHDASAARDAFSILREGGISNISVDIISGVAVQNDASLARTVEEILSWRPEHISSYQLSIEEGSALAKMVELGQYVEMSDDDCRRQYDFLCHSLAAAGYNHYEISNWALPGREARHNSAYWKRIPYVGLGPGAHSLRGRDVRSWNSSTLPLWTSSEEHLDEKEIREEEIMLGLRTSAGVDGRRIPENDWFIADSIIADMI